MKIKSQQLFIMLSYIILYILSEGLIIQSYDKILG